MNKTLVTPSAFITVANNFFEFVSEVKSCLLVCTCMISISNIEYVLNFPNHCALFVVVTEQV